MLRYIHFFVAGVWLSRRGQSSFFHPSTFSEVSRSLTLPGPGSPTFGGSGPFLRALCAAIQTCPRRGCKVGVIKPSWVPPPTRQAQPGDAALSPIASPVSMPLGRFIHKKWCFAHTITPTFRYRRVASARLGEPGAEGTIPRRAGDVLSPLSRRPSLSATMPTDACQGRVLCPFPGPSSVSLPMCLHTHTANPPSARTDRGLANFPAWHAVSRTVLGCCERVRVLRSPAKSRL